MDSTILSSSLIVDEESALKNQPITDALLDYGTYALECLQVLRKRGWDAPSMDSHFKKQRANAEQADDKMTGIWYKRYQRVFAEVANKTNFKFSARGYLFLDLGCCPGGYSAQVLKNNPHAHGIGISLPPEKGGHKSLLEPRLQARYQLIFSDITWFQLSSDQINHQRLHDLPDSVKSSLFDLVIMDGHPLHQQRKDNAPEDILPWDGHRLLLSQLIIALRYVKDGGTIVLKLKLPESSLTARLLYAFDCTCLSIDICKPLSMHQLRSTFYLVASGVGLGISRERRTEFLAGFERLWTETTFSGVDGNGRWLTDEDLDFIIPIPDLIQTYIPRLASLGRDVWYFQAEAIKGKLNNQGIKTDDIILCY